MQITRPNLSQPATLLGFRAADSREDGGSPKPLHCSRGQMLFYCKLGLAVGVVVVVVVVVVVITNSGHY